MATAAKRKPKAGPVPAAGTVLNVSYGNVNFGDKTVRLACSMARELSPGAVDKLLVGRRLTVAVLARSAGGSEQAGLPGMGDQDVKLTGVADSKSVGMGPKAYTFGLTFVINDVSGDDLKLCAKRFGQITIQGVADIPAEEAGGDDADTGSEK